MSDPGFARRMAGNEFQRADAVRDERASPKQSLLENWLVDALGWLPSRAVSEGEVHFLNQAVEASRGSLVHGSDTMIKDRMQVAATAMRYSNPTRLPDLLSEALACVSVAAERRLGLRPHPVQLAGARTLLRGELAEMKTGEGKTLVAAMAATVMAATGAKVHVISTNDYLAERDCTEMSALFEFFALSSGYVCGGMKEDQRRAAYSHPICYASGKEVVFDYLKDRLAGQGLAPARVSRLLEMASDRPAPPGRLIPALHFAIVDEADSVMIDEARTPMILSRDAPPIFDPVLLEWAFGAARQLVVGRHFKLTADRQIEVLPVALEEAPALPVGTPASWQSRSWREQLLRQALTALHLFHRDQHYILADEKVQIVDESTGRVMPDRSWEHGLHQLIEVKEGVKLTSGRETLERMTYQRFFRRYYLLSGLTGTAAEASREMWAVYRLRVRQVPPNRPLLRQRFKDQFLPTMSAKWACVADVANIAARRGQPVLIGTRSVQASEQLSRELESRDLAHTVLNARQDAQEAEIIALAGQPGRITVATNMAGRGTDIKLSPVALAAGGLFVILTEFHESPRVDRQLFGRSSRQGEPGGVQAIVCAEDPVFKRQPSLLKLLAVKLGPTGGVVLRSMLWLAQREAERQAYQARRQTLRGDRELHRLIGFAGKPL